MGEMVERVAESLFVQHYFPAPALWDGEPEQRKQFYRDMARAAIKAMREPTEAMIVAGTLADWVGEAESREGLSIMPNDDYGTPIGIWPEMIDAALGEQKDG